MAKRIMTYGVNSGLIFANPLTQNRAPTNGGECCQVDKILDRGARRQISYELGHGRADVVAAYV
ncbi:hypothetical protein EMIT0P265_30661 [Pseudomonas zeae]